MQQTSIDQPTVAQAETAVEVLRLLADPTRLRLLWLLAHGDRDVNTLVELTGAPRASVSQHLAKLRLGGLVTVRRDGRRMIYHARGGHVRTLVTEVLHHADHLVGGHPDHD